MTNHLTSENSSSLFKKIKTTIMAGLTISALLLVIGNGGNIVWFPPLVVFPLVAIAMLCAFAFPFIWHHLESNQKANSNKIYGILFGIIRYCIAINIASFG